MSGPKTLNNMTEEQKKKYKTLSIALMLLCVIFLWWIGVLNTRLVSFEEYAEEQRKEKGLYFDNMIECIKAQTE